MSVAFFYKLIYIRKMSLGNFFLYTMLISTILLLRIFGANSMVLEINYKKLINYVIYQHSNHYRTRKGEEQSDSNVIQNKFYLTTNIIKRRSKQNEKGR